MRAIDENADQVYYKYRITAPHPENQKLVEHLFVVPPTVVAQALDLLADWDLVPDLHDFVLAFADGFGELESAA